MSEMIVSTVDIVTLFVRWVASGIVIMHVPLITVTRF